MRKYTDTPRDFAYWAGRCPYVREQYRNGRALSAMMIRHFRAHMLDAEFLTRYCAELDQHNDYFRHGALELVNGWGARQHA